MERGDLVDDDVVVSLAAERLDAADVRSGGFVLDGFPRTVDQAEALAGLLADKTLDRAVIIDVPLATNNLRHFRHLDRLKFLLPCRPLPPCACGHIGPILHN